MKKQIEIVERVLETLKSGEKEKVVSFFEGLKKFYTSSISKLEHNQKSLEFKYAADVDNINDRLVDAREDLDNAWLKVDLDKIKTREEQKNYINEYNVNISRATSIVENLEEDLEKLKESHEKDLQDIKDQIEEYKSRLSKIK